MATFLYFLIILIIASTICHNRFTLLKLYKINLIGYEAYNLVHLLATA